MKLLSNVKKLAAFSAATTLPIFSLTAANWAQDATGTFNWEDAVNWSTNPSPAPGDTGAATGEIANILSGSLQNRNLVVDINSNLPVATGNVRIDASQGATASNVLNINNGGTLNANNTTTTLLTLNEGGTNNPGASATINVFTGGTLNASQIRLARDEGTSSVNVNGGAVNWTGGGGGAPFAMRTDSANATAELNISNGGTFTSDNNGAQFLMGSATSLVTVSGSSTFQMLGNSGVGGRAILNMNTPNAVATDTKISLDGSSATFVVEDINLFSQTVSGSMATLELTADSAGVSTVDIINSGNINLSSDGTTNSILDLDLTNYNLANGTSLVIADYTNGNYNGGTFDTINVTGANFDSIDYLTGSLITVNVTAVPEPAAYALLFGVTGLVFGVIQRRKSSK
ncbi:hypothetical protein [Rubellicoccus peritrichatus]|uniref:PEP-CTERM protein-sorting domain-containing protein n=1 Tax=Rubellicoccus peritrichatus TaxID=3080537 RepID=A0AAQ3L6K3_9BACT|nr:hypothetical protein [Puniceicoccus sp. CR14]WOO40265.1 hypothetical protein RZN69_16725 [Puniceicoccus sp. CR14]